MATNQNVRPDEAPPSIVEEFTAHAACFPEVLAVSSASESLTYGELDARSNQLARFLQNLGAGPEVIVGVHLKRSCDLVVTLLGVLKAGAAYLPLDPEYPRSRLKLMIESSRAKIIVNQECSPDLFDTYCGTVICIDGHSPLISKEAASPLPAPPTSHALAYILYTSGSSGRPKGVMVEHRSLSNFIHSMRRMLAPSKSSVVAALTSVSFDISILEIFLPLSCGGSVAMFTRDSIYDPPKLISEINERQITLLQATPSTWRILLDAGLKSKTIIALCGGESLQPELAAQLASNFKEAWNMYGPTETTVWSSMERIRAGQPVFIGKPIDNTRLYVLDERLDWVSSGDVGELYIAGAGLARGYLDLPGLTADRFVADTLGGGNRMYRTGDRVRLHGKSDIEFVGRADWQVKLRGYRIELEEVEAFLLKHPSVTQAVVAVRGSDDADKRLVAFIVTVNAGSLPLRDLKEILKDALPPYMIPSEYIELESFPLTPSGKVDRYAISRVKGTPIAIWSYEAPRNELEQAVAEIWQEILKIHDLSIHDHFLDLGGHSLPAMRITAKICETFDVAVSMALIFSEPTIAQYTSALRQKSPKSFGVGANA